MFRLATYIVVVLIYYVLDFAYLLFHCVTSKKKGNDYSQVFSILKNNLDRKNFVP